MQQSTPTAYAAATPQAYSPPRSSQLPPQRAIPPPTATGAPSIRTVGGASASLAVQDPVIEARKSIALVRSSGLIDKLERDVTAVLDSYDKAYEPGTGPAPDLESMYNTLDNLIAVLSRSSLGAYSKSSLENPPQVSQRDLEKAGRDVQALFKEVQRCKEGAEIVRAGLVG